MIGDVTEYKAEQLVKVTIRFPDEEHTVRAYIFDMCDTGIGKRVRLDGIILDKKYEDYLDEGATLVITQHGPSDLLPRYIGAEVDTHPTVQEDMVIVDD